MIVAMTTLTMICAIAFVVLLILQLLHVQPISWSYVQLPLTILGLIMILVWLFGYFVK